MANLKASIKDIRTARRRRERNIRQKNIVKQVVKEYKVATQDGDTAKAQELLSRSYKLLDKAAKNGIIHHNAASRKKSRLTKLMAK